MAYSLIEKICTGCGVGHPPTVEYFSPNKQGKNGLHSRCRECRNAEQKKYPQAKRNKRNKRLNRMACEKYRATINGTLCQRFCLIKHRCEDPGDKDYKNYGGRGIECRFKNSDDFVDYVVNILKVDPRGLQIDRIDNNGHYEPGNIRFVTRLENLKNRRGCKKNLC